MLNSSKLKVESPQKILGASLLAVLLFQAGVPGPREYKNAAGFKVIVSPVGKSSGDPSNESKLDFFAPGRERLCTLDYSSQDGKHGFGVARAEWTPDQNFLAFSLVSSGGHQPWHAPTAFYRAKSTEIFSLDGYLGGAGVAKSNFDLEAPNAVVTELWKDKPVPITVSLAELAGSPRGNSRPLQCAGGKIFKREFQVLR